MTKGKKKIKKNKGFGEKIPRPFTFEANPLAYKLIDVYMQWSVKISGYRA